MVTIHDVTFFSAPDLHRAVKGGFYRSAIKTSMRRARRCIVPSKATRDELIRLLDADPAKIDVAYHGVDTEVFHPPTDAEKRRVSDRLGLHGRPYIAFLGELARRKNVPSLVRGYVQAVRDLADPLRGFLGGALVVAFPSIAEGFGLPALEAMACGGSVLTTRRLSLPEVGGDAVAYTEPDVMSIAAGLRDLIEAPDRRAALAEAGVARAREFTWAASAEAHLAAYSRAAQELTVDL